MFLWNLQYIYKIGKHIDNNKNEISKLLEDSSYIIIAWGSLDLKILKEYANLVIHDFIGLENMEKIIALKRPSLSPKDFSCCYHPLIRPTEKNKNHTKDFWVNEIVKQIENI